MRVASKIYSISKIYAVRFVARQVTVFTAFQADASALAAALQSPLADNIRHDFQVPGQMSLYGLTNLARD